MTLSTIKGDKMAQKTLINKWDLMMPNGDVQSYRTEQQIVTNEPRHVKLYLDAVCVLKELTGVNTKFLCELLPYMKYSNDDTNCEQLIVLNSYVRKNIAEKLNWKRDTATKRVSKELNSLCKKNLLHKLANNTYMVNPNIFGRGSWKDIRCLREATFDFWTQSVISLKADMGEDISDVPFDMPPAEPSPASAPQS